MEPKMIDHLFRHQYGKMVSILTRVFGLAHLETIEDAIQDTFVRAMSAWRIKTPENPEAWLTKAAKNRVVDLFRKIKADNSRIQHLDAGPAAMTIDNLFLDNEIEDSQLRMIFTACHPVLAAQDQLAFALKTVSGFSTKEIASALLIKEETIKKRLSRARKSVQTKSVAFEIPTGKSLPTRLNRVLEVLYLIFNEGFHSNGKQKLIRQDLCAEAMRLCQLVLKNEQLRMGNSYALLALMCFHASRLDSKVDENDNIVDLKNQDRTKWHWPLIKLGNTAMNKAVEEETFSSFHYEAAIAAEHLKARSFDDTNWNKILQWYEQMYVLQSTAFTLLNKAVVLLQLEKAEAAHRILQLFNPDDLEQRTYLYFSVLAHIHIKKKEFKKAESCFEKALELVNNETERKYLLERREVLLNDQ